MGVQRAKNFWGCPDVVATGRIGTVTVTGCVQVPMVGVCSKVIATNVGWVSINFWGMVSTALAYRNPWC